MRHHLPETFALGVARGAGIVMIGFGSYLLLAATLNAN